MLCASFSCAYFTLYKLLLAELNFVVFVILAGDRGSSRAGRLRFGHILHETIYSRRV